MERRAPRDPRAAVYERIYAVVRRIPRGRVATYGQVASLAGLGDHARQVGYALHHRESPGEAGEAGGETPFDVQRRIARATTVLPPLPEDRFLCSFGHIFAGGYAAGYYSYKWAEVLSADAFAAFEEAGLETDDALHATGARFRDTVLALGGSRPPMEVFVAFRGREPRTEALLRHAGLEAA